MKHEIEIVNRITGDGWACEFRSDAVCDAVILFNTRLGLIAHAWVTWERLMHEPVHETLPVFLNAIQRECDDRHVWRHVPRVWSICERDGVADRSDARTVAEWATPVEAEAKR